MDRTWQEMYEAARAVQGDREISRFISAGGVAAAVLSESGKIYVGVCIDSACTLGICAERNAIFSMITGGENVVKRVIAVMPDGNAGAPCGACRELMAQLSPEKYRDIEVMMDYRNDRVVRLGELLPDWWG